MPTLATVKHDALFYMFKGEPGTRKSTQALSFPGPQYWFSTDQKMEALLLPMKEFGIDPTTIEYDDFETFDAVLMKLKQFQMSCSFKTLIIDSITSLGNVINNQTRVKKQGTTTKEGDKKGGVIGGISVNTLEDYKAEMSAFQQVLAALLDIRKFHKVNIILIAHIIGERKPDERGTTHHARIIITGGKAISGLIPIYCTEVYHFDIKKSVDADEEGKYGLLTVHTGDDYARTSLGLRRRIEFLNSPLYAKYVAPAIQKMADTKPISTPKKE